jgi:hypothetical protein
MSLHQACQVETRLLRGILGPLRAGCAFAGVGAQRMRLERVFDVCCDAPDVSDLVSHRRVSFSQLDAYSAGAGAIELGSLREQPTWKECRHRLKRS